MTPCAGHLHRENSPNVGTRRKTYAWLGAVALAAEFGMSAPASADDRPAWSAQATAQDPAEWSAPPSTDDPAEWSMPVQPFRIAEKIYYVGTEGLAAYLIVSNQGAILLDGTTAENAALIERNIAAVGVPLHAVKRLISDHAHPDHVGALAQIKQDSGAEFLASAGDRWALEHGRVRGDTNYRPEPFAPIKVDRVVRDGETVQLGGVRLTAHLTPGHTPGCTSWSTTVQDQGRPLDVLFLCSITVAGNILVCNHAYPKIVSDYRATFRKLESLKADIVLPSHPDVADVLEREARREAGEPDAFIDPQVLPSLVAHFSAAFETALAAAHEMAHCSLSDLESVYFPLRARTPTAERGAPPSGRR
jgi:metallo-beta-lactamase class B